MAAGNARRFGSNKLSVIYQGKSLIRHTLDAIPQEAVRSVVVVTQYSEIAVLAKEYHFTAILNQEPELGISHTVALGLSALSAYDGVLFLVSDQPLLRRQSVAALIELWRSHPSKIAALSHDGIRGNPCLFPARFFSELLHLQGDRGGNAVIRRHPEELVLLDVDSLELYDVDTAQALEALEHNL